MYTSCTNTQRKPVYTGVAQGSTAVVTVHSYFSGVSRTSSPFPSLLALPKRATKHSDGAWRPLAGWCTRDGAHEAHVMTRLAPVPDPGFSLSPRMEACRTTRPRAKPASFGTRHPNRDMYMSQAEGRSRRRRIGAAPREQVCCCLPTRARSPYVDNPGGTGARISFPRTITGPYPGPDDG